jgi:cyclic-di-GMP phosphodiesterase TipF (flagellum assembly factor)
VQSLVYILIGLGALGIGAAAYFGFTFTPIEAFVTALVFGAIAVLVLERTLRQRAEARLEKANEDLSRLHSTNAQAGATLSQRVNALADENAGKRLESLEADISVLGTAVRQVAEALAELEEHRRPAIAPAEPGSDADSFPEPVIPLEMLREALDEGRLVCHLEPIVQLPTRKPYGYTVVPRLVLEDGELADPPDFMPRQGGADLVQRIEAVALMEGIVIARRARTGSQAIVLHLPLSRGTLGDPAAVQQVQASLDANKAIAGNLIFNIQQPAFRGLGARERGALPAMAKAGAGFCLGGAATLRLDFAELQGLGFRAIRIDAHLFIDKPQTLTDFHSGDIAAYARRHGIELIGTGVVDEQQVLGLFEDGVTLVQGPFLGAAGPARADLLPERTSTAGLAPRRVGV